MPTAHALLRQPAGLAIGSAAVVLGAVMLVAAAFLPWLRSGETVRSSFQTARLLERFHVLPEPLTPLVLIWPLLPPLVVLPLLLIALRVWRCAGVSAGVLALLFAVTAGSTLYYGAGASAVGISLATDGPIFMLVGAAVMFAGGVGLFVARQRWPARPREDPSRAVPRRT